MRCLLGLSAFYPVRRRGAVACERSASRTASPRKPAGPPTILRRTEICAKAVATLSVPFEAVL